MVKTPTRKQKATKRNKDTTAEVVKIAKDYLRVDISQCYTGQKRSEQFITLKVQIGEVHNALSAAVLHGYYQALEESKILLPNCPMNQENGTIG